MITVGEYLARRLRERGVDHLFGLPGDFNLALLDELTPVIEWVGSTNELNAAYAADGYARRRGLAALVTTFGVGELSAFNGIAGAAAESVPVIQITGAPATATSEAKSLLHHTLVDGDFDHFIRAYDELVCGSVTLSAEHAPEQIDELIQLAVFEQKPVYLRVPVDVVTALVSEERLARPLDCVPTSDSASLSRFAAGLRRALAEPGNVVVLIGHLAARVGLGNQIARLADTGRVRIATLLDAKGMLDETHPASLGTYIGALTADPHTRSIVEGAATIVTIGTVLSDLLTGMFSHRLGDGQVIGLDLTSARIGDREFADVTLADTTAVLLDAVKRERRDPCTTTNHSESRPQETIVADTGGLSQQQLWSEIQDWLPAGSPVVADAGTAFYGAAGLTMSGGTELIGQPIWSSIGYTLPATLGIGLAGRARPVLLIGDGSAQLTIQELATFGPHGVRPVIVLVNNGGYTVERTIRSPYAVYQDVTRWNWTALVSALLPDHPTLTCSVRSALELHIALNSASDHPDHLVFIEAFTDALDVPPLLAAIGEGLNTLAMSPSNA